MHQTTQEQLQKSYLKVIRFPYSVDGHQIGPKSYEEYLEHYNALLKPEKWSNDPVLFETELKSVICVAWRVFSPQQVRNLVNSMPQSRNEIINHTKEAQLICYIFHNLEKSFIFLLACSYNISRVQTNYYIAIIQIVFYV